MRAKKGLLNRDEGDCRLLLQRQPQAARKGPGAPSTPSPSPALLPRPTSRPFLLLLLPRRRVKQRTKYLVWHNSVRSHWLVPLYSLEVNLVVDGGLVGWEYLPEIVFRCPPSRLAPSFLLSPSLCRHFLPFPLVLSLARGSSSCAGHVKFFPCFLWRMIVRVC